MIDPSPSTEIVLTSDSFADDPAIESLSPAALVVLNSYMAGYGWLDGPTKMDCRGVAAALRAVAEQLGESRAPGVEFEDLYPRIIEVDELLAIADELEA
jgi:hypothetical protein